MVRRDLIALAAGLPLALFGIVMPANEYRSGGVDAVDCDGPLKVLLFALPALTIFGLGLVAYGLPFRRRRNLLVAGACAVLCALLATNVVQAVRENAANAQAPKTCG